MHGVELEDDLADEDKEDEAEDEVHDDLGAYEQLEVMCDEFHDNLGGFMDDHSVGCACC